MPRIYIMANGIKPLLMLNTVYLFAFDNLCIIFLFLLLVKILFSEPHSANEQFDYMYFYLISFYSNHFISIPI